jgi:hypothetical protein
MELIIFVNKWDYKEEGFRKLALELGYDISKELEKDDSLKFRTDGKLINYIKQNGTKYVHCYDEEDLKELKNIYKNNNDGITYELGNFKVINVNTNKQWAIRYDDEYGVESITYMQPVIKELNYYGII